MTDVYWPWSRIGETKPRGFKNIRLEGLFPNDEYENAKRWVGTLVFGHGGGGEPLTNKGKKITGFHEDPFLRFQFGSKDLRRYVDNDLRYKTTRSTQEEYKKQLDKLVKDTTRKKQNEKTENTLLYQEQCLKTPPWGRPGPGGNPWRNPNTIGQHFFKSLGWSNGNTLEQLKSEEIRNELEQSKIHSDGKNTYKNDHALCHRKSFLPAIRNNRLFPLSNNTDNGVELVSVLARNRHIPKFSLCSSDVTCQRNKSKSSLRNRTGSYLKELKQEIILKQQKLKEVKDKENESVEHHFSTWKGFWGRPGHGAPLSELKRHSLNQLLYPQLTFDGIR